MVTFVSFNLRENGEEWAFGIQAGWPLFIGFSFAKLLYRALLMAWPHHDYLLHGGSRGEPARVFLSL